MAGSRKKPGDRVKKSGVKTVRKGRKRTEKSSPGRDDRISSERVPGLREEMNRQTSLPDSSTPEALEKEMNGIADAAPPGESAEAHEEFVELLAFKVAGESYAFRVTDVREILRRQKISRVPRMEPHVMGITSLRGMVIPVLDIRCRLEPEVKRRTEKNTRIMIVNGPKGPIGAMLDGPVDMVAVAESKILEPPANLSEDEAGFIEGVAASENGFISVLRVEAALNFSVAWRPDEGKA